MDLGKGDIVWMVGLLKMGRVCAQGGSGVREGGD